jgi:invasion protein IalB
MIVLAMSAIHTGALAQLGTVKATHGAWQVNCAKPPGKKAEKCALVQSVTAEDRPNVGLTVMFLKTVDGNKQLLRIVAPLGVLLPAGLGLKIDDTDIGQAPFIKCGKIGCVSEVVVKDDLIAKLKSGKQAIFVIFQTPESGIGIPISLEGFTAGLGSVK